MHSIKISFSFSEITVRMIQRLELPRLENENSVENPDWLSMKNQRQRTVLDKETDDKVKCALDIYSRMKMALGNSLVMFCRFDETHGHFQS